MGNGASFQEDDFGEEDTELGINLAREDASNEDMMSPDPTRPMSPTSPNSPLSPGQRMSRAPSLKSAGRGSSAGSLGSMFNRLNTRRATLRNLLLVDDVALDLEYNSQSGTESPGDQTKDGQQDRSTPERTRRLSVSSLHRAWRESVEKGNEGTQDLHLRFQPRNTFAAMSTRMLLANSGRFGSMFEAVKKNDGSLTVLGKGMEGEVFRVRKKGSPQHQYALKTVHLRSSAEKDRAFELRHLSRLSHPNIVRLHEAFKHNPKTYLLSFELGSGGDLLSRLQRDGPMEERRSADVLMQILSALQYLHFHNVIHRDIKLENFVFRFPESDEVMLVDFGLAKLTDAKTVQTSEVGTIHYLSPEVIKRSYSFPADIWSLGVVAYMMLTAKRPFRGTTDEQIVQRILACDVTYPDKLWGNLSDGAQRFVKTLLNPEPSARPSAEKARGDRWIREQTQNLHLTLLENADARMGRRDSLSSTPSSVCERASTSSTSSDFLDMSMEDVIARMREFAQFPQLKRYALRQLAREAPADALSDLFLLFRRLVARTPGVVTFERLRDMIPDELMDDTELDTVFDAIDEDTKGYFTWNDFCAVLYTPMPGSPRAQTDAQTVFLRFAYLGPDGDSTNEENGDDPDEITVNSLHHIFQDTHSRSEAKEMILEASATVGAKARTLSQEDFVRLLFA
ncbi:Protein kinase, putative [Hondaea fermentalgiana]|uniref:Protein kinase, putative n=1 Tax=Hondaea fermentalgiana TaxID=2315210 RepID=A0A2R5G4D4_9STRA|nr:Protein kinase, putative [Hondaea fermentalgiana]|eukprot:GBG25887.1 Protein kinase, putative [Hondaea fermentalgiana]